MENNKDSKINKAVFYFVNTLKPAYDKCYDLITDFDKNINQKFNDPADLLKYHMEHKKNINEANEFLKNKKEEFEILKVDFNGFDLKEMDNRIKKSK